MRRKNYFALATLLVGVTGITSCGGVTENWVDDPNGKFDGYTNPTIPLPERGSLKDTITIDGKFDESIYKDLVWLERTDPTSGMAVRTTTTVDDKGLYLAFDVDDSLLFVNPLRNSFENSGVECYLALNNPTTIESNAYEVDFSLDGKVYPKLQFRGNWEGLDAPYEYAPFEAFAVKGGDGKVNTTVQKEGYTIEAFMPWEYFEKMQNITLPENKNDITINLHPALIQSNSYDVGSGRIWWDSASSKSGFGWTNPQTWFTFTNEGLKHVDFESEVSEGGSISYTEKYIEYQGNVTINIDVEEGYRIKDLSVNGVDYLPTISYKEGKPFITLMSVTEDTKLVLNFEPIPEDVNDVTKKITYEDIQLDDGDSLRFELFAQGVSYDVEVNEDNTSYTVKNVPSDIVGEMTVYSALNGYAIQRFEINGADSLPDITINKNVYGGERSIAINDMVTHGTQEKFADVSGDFDSLISNKNNALHLNVKIEGDLDEEGILIPNEDPARYNVEFKCWFYKKEDKINTLGELNFQILQWDGVWRVKVMGNQKEGNDLEHIFWNPSAKPEEGSVEFEMAKNLGTKGLNLVFCTTQEDYSLLYQRDDGSYVELLTQPFTNKGEVMWQYIDLTDANETNPNFITYVSNAAVYQGQTKEDLLK